MKRVAVGLLILAGLAGCAGGKSGLPKPGEASQVKVVQASALPPPTDSDLYGAGRPYLIGPADRIAVDVYGIPELSRESQVDSAGQISVPLLGQVTAAGKAPAQLAEEVEAGLRGRFVRNPDVTISIKEVSSQVYTVDGEVGSPGLYPVVGKMTLQRAVASAKGATEFAQLENVVILRTVEGQRMAALYDLKQIRRGVYADPEIYANDVVVVGNSQSRRIFKDVIQMSPLLAGPLIAILQNN